MSLNTRAAMDPRWPFHHRQVARGFMLGTGVLTRTQPLTPGTSTWQPFATDPADREPVSPTLSTPIYRGPCRVQPNKGWRARKQSSRDETYVEHVILIQLDMMENELAGSDPKVLPVMRPGDVFTVTGVHTLNDWPVDLQVKDYQYIVRNITASTNSWVRNLVCDNDVTKAVV